MKAFYLIFATSTFLFGCNSSKKFESTKDKQNFFKWIIEQQPEDEDKVFNQTINLAIGSFWIFKTEGKLTKKDSFDIQQQISITNGNTLSTNIVGKRTIVTNEKEDYYLKFSNPIFFDNYKKVWIYKQLWIKGEPGYESIEVYELRHDGYKRLFGTTILNDNDIK